MSILNALLRTLFDGLLFPFRTLPPWIALTLISLVTAIAMLLVFKKTSNQDKMDAVKRRIHASLFEIRLFNDDLRAIFRAIFHILGHNVSYVGLTIVPLLWMIVPLVLMMAQLQFHYGYQGFEPGDQTLVRVELSDAAASQIAIDTKPQVELVVPAGLAVASGPAWLPAINEINWRLAAAERGSYEIEVRYEGESFTKTVEVSPLTIRRSPSRLAPTFVNQLLYPAEAPLPDGAPVQSIAFIYPSGNAGIPGWENELTWMGVFFVLSLVFAFALRKPLGVTI